MIHPSTMAGPNWFTGSFGTTSPFQQNSSSFFRNTPFGGGGPGPANNPFQSLSFGFNSNPTQMQNTINEIVRQTVPTILANFGMTQGSFGFQTQQAPFGFQTPFNFQTPTGPAQYGPQFTNSSWGTDWQSQIQNQFQNQFQNQNFLAEVIRQSTNQAIQNLMQQNPNAFGQGISGIGTTPFAANAFNTNWQQQVQQLQQQQIQQLQQQQQQQSFWNTVSQVCQTVAACVIACLTPQNQIQSTPFNINTGSTQFGVSAGIPTGAGAF